METKNFTITNKAIRSYRDRLAAVYSRKGMETIPKECIAKTYVAVNDACAVADAAYIRDESGEITNKDTVDNAKQTIIVVLMHKREIPRRWSPAMCMDAKFMITDW